MHGFSHAERSRLESFPVTRAEMSPYRMTVPDSLPAFGSKLDPGIAALKFHIASEGGAVRELGERGAVESTGKTPGQL